MDDVVLTLSPKFAKVVDVVRTDLATIRTGKASSALLENIFVDAYGTKMKLVELATISATDPTTLLVTPFDIANAEAIAAAIQNANLGLSTIVEETKVRVVVPPLSQERREEYAKLAKTKMEGGKIMARQVRHDGMEDITKMNTDEDTRGRLEKEVQLLVDKTVEQLELLALEKEKELLTL